MMTDVPELPHGTLVGSYQIEGVVGWGGMGVVYRASQRRPLRTVALKVIRSGLAADPEFRRRFEAEADAAASIEHTNVLPIYETGEYRGLLYLAMRYIDGTDLREWLIENGSMSPARAADVVLQVGKALDAAHASGLVHRDVKPGNVLLSRQHGEDHVYLTDFGLAKKSSSAAQFTRTGTWVGTVDYVAPEQIRGEHIDARSDVYSLGCVLYQLVSGKVPFERDSEVSKLFAHLNEPPPSLALASPLLDEVVHKAMAKDPSARYASAGDLGRAAVAAAEMRSIDVGSNPVAAGAAAPPGITDPGATRIDEGRHGTPAPAAPAYAETAAGSAPAPYGDAAAGAPPLAPPPGTQGPPAPTPPPVGPPGGYVEPSPAPTGPSGGRRKPWIAVLVGLGALAVAGVVVVLVLGGGSSGPTSKQLVKRVVARYWNASGSKACDYLSPRELSFEYGGLAGCRKATANFLPSPIGGAQHISVTGTNATDSATVSGHPWKLTLVKEDGRWLIDSRLNLDSVAIIKLGNSWAEASGPRVCDLYSPSNIKTHYGSLSSCQASYKNEIASTVQGNQSITFQSASHATDYFKVSGLGLLKMLAAKQPSGSWLIDFITKA
jgi:predicted Ser/Thr protein kinase